MALIYDHDYCLHANCADNADCSEIQFGHKCSCHRGYKGDGINFCNDIDECSLANRKWLHKVFINYQRIAAIRLLVLQQSD